VLLFPEDGEARCMVRLAESPDSFTEGDRNTRLPSPRLTSVRPLLDFLLDHPVLLLGVGYLMARFSPLGPDDPAEERHQQRKWTARRQRRSRRKENGGW
jgi:hypothetical protein